MPRTGWLRFAGAAILAATRLMRVRYPRSRSCVSSSSRERHLDHVWGVAPCGGALHRAVAIKTSRRDTVKVWLVYLKQAGARSTTRTYATSSPKVSAASRTSARPKGRLARFRGTRPGRPAPVPPHRLARGCRAARRPAHLPPLMGRMEADLGSRLDWINVNHWNTDNPHTLISATKFSHPKKRLTFQAWEAG
ncbi:MAG: hypothetical protein DID89_2727546244 [Candidatus Nitrotoga sp. CP45]|nr:MAG: hypothetical protein DID89_2727546244 [Candidatus Nitrotoga sp. CP45]